LAQLAGFTGVGDDSAQVAAGQDQRRAAKPGIRLGGGCREDAAQADSHDANSRGVHLRTRGQHVDRAAHVRDALRQRLDEQPRVAQQRAGASGRTPFAVIGELDHDCRDTSRSERGASDLLQLEVAVEDVQADHGRPLRRIGANSRGQVVIAGDGIVLRHRSHDRRWIAETIDAVQPAGGPQLGLVGERLASGNLRDDRRPARQHVGAVCRLAHRRSGERERRHGCHQQPDAARCKSSVHGSKPVADGPVVRIGRTTISSLGWHIVTAHSVAFGIFVVATGMPTRGFAA